VRNEKENEGRIDEEKKYRKTCRNRHPKKGTREREEKSSKQKDHEEEMVLG